MDGRELVACLAEFQPSVKAFYVSGYIDHRAVTPGLAEVGYGHLPKPFKNEELNRAVREALDV
jgi:DNA-binding NarL/FixJ family response regulator